LKDLPRGKWRFDDFFKWAGVLHRDIAAMSLYEFIMATRGYGEAHGAKPRGGTIADGRLSEMGIVGF
jgi:hypothetical protein